MGFSTPAPEKRAMITETPLVIESLTDINQTPAQDSWNKVLSGATKSVEKLLLQLDIPLTELNQRQLACLDFPLLVPQPFIDKMEKGNANDPLLLQVLPQSDELESVEGSYIKIFSFAFTFVVILISVSITGKILTKIAKILFLGFLNKLFGGLFGAIKYILIVSFCIVFFENINSEFSFVDNKIIESTFLYNPILNFGNQLLSFLNLSANSINFFN